MNAVCGVDFQLRRALLLHNFIDGRGTKILAGISVLDEALRRANVRVRNDKVTGLIVFVTRAAVVHVRQPVEGELAVPVEALRSGPAVDFVIGLVARVRAHGIDQAASAGDELQARVKQSAEQAALK